MKKIVLKPKIEIDIPVEAEVIKPEAFAGKGLKEIEKLAVYQGNSQFSLGKFFDVNGEVPADPSEAMIIIEGDVSRVKRIGEGMSTGEILIKGNGGMYLGARMSGGRLIVEGNAGPWAGQQMTGGEILIKGDAGDYLAGSYRGDWRGMQGGRIVVEGNAGNEVGEWMMSGVIEVKGNVGLYTGVHMQGGLIIIGGNIEGRLGAQMTKGNIVVKGMVPELLPSFRFKGEIDNPKLEDRTIEGKFLEFIGDLAERGKGSLFLALEPNKHLISKFS